MPPSKKTHATPRKKKSVKRRTGKTPGSTAIDDEDCTASDGSALASGRAAQEMALAVLDEHEEAPDNHINASVAPATAPSAPSAPTPPSPPPPSPPPVSAFPEAAEGEATLAPGASSEGAAATHTTADFETSASFTGPRIGRVFKSGDRGLGYYLDVLPMVTSAPLVDPPSEAPPPAVRTQSSEELMRITLEAQADALGFRLSTDQTEVSRLRVELAANRGAPGGENAPATLALLAQLSAALEASGELDEAVALLRETVDARTEAAGGAQDAGTIESLAALARLLAKSGKRSAAVELTREVLQARCETRQDEAHEEVRA